MTRLITTAIYNGTKQSYAISGMTVDKCMAKISKMRNLRNVSVFMFYSRKTGKLVDVRFS